MNLFAQKDDFLEIDPVNLEDFLLEAWSEFLDCSFVSEEKVYAVPTDDRAIIFQGVFSVEIPTRGPFEDIDIRPNEKIWIQIDKSTYPGEMPKIFSARHDFPKDKLDHINPSAKNEPAWLCLTNRVSEDWFAGRSFSDLLDQIKSWLDDAVSGNLIKHREPFESIMDIGVGGICFFDEGKILPLIEPDAESGFIFFEWRGNQNLIYTQNFIQADDVSSENFKKSIFPGILLFNNSPQSNRIRYYPRTLWELQTLSTDFGLKFQESYSKLKETLSDVGSRSVLSRVPYIIAVKRDRRVQGEANDWEWIPLAVDVNATTAGGIATPRLAFFKYESEEDWGNILVTPLFARKIFAPQMARRISAIMPDREMPKICILGAGALGSKICMSLARQGFEKITIVDNDLFTPHNLARHTLQWYDIHQPKSEALSRHINQMYSGQVAVEALVENIVKKAKLDPDFFNAFDYILDFTASDGVYEALTVNEKISQPKVISGYLTPDGLYSFLLIEGESRNPRLDDLFCLINQHQLTGTPLKKLPIIEQDQTEDFIEIGAGCRSQVTIMPDDIVSFHASMMTMSIKSYIINQRKDAECVIFNLTEDNGSILPSSQILDLTNFNQLSSMNANGWKLRISSSLANDLIDLCKEKSPNETGGILVGQINVKHKIITAVHSINAPDDSEERPYLFIRGVEGLFDKVNQIYQSSGGNLVYVGEWHTHPNGSDNLSAIDKGTLNKIITHQRKFHLPAMIVIVNQSGIHPHIEGFIK